MILFNHLKYLLVLFYVVLVRKFRMLSFKWFLLHFLSYHIHITYTGNCKNSLSSIFTSLLPWLHYDIDNHFGCHGNLNQYNNTLSAMFVPAINPGISSLSCITVIFVTCSIPTHKHGFPLRHLSQYDNYVYLSG